MGRNAKTKRRFVTKEHIEEMARLYFEELKDVNSIAEAMAMDNTTIYKYLKANYGDKLRPANLKGKLPETVQAIIIEAYLSGKHMAAIAEDIGLGYSTVNKYIKNHTDLEVRNSKFTKTNIVGKPDYFKVIDSEEKAYFLGFIACDGSIGQRKGIMSGSIKITLQVRDEHILKRFLEEIDSNSSIRYYTRKSDGRTYSVLNVECMEMARDLSNYGIYSNKTLTLKSQLHMVPEEFKCSYIRGCVDADGSIMYIKRRNRPSYMMKVGITGTKDMLQPIGDYLGYKYTLWQDKRAAHGCTWNIEINRKDSVRDFYERVYKNASIALDRKLNKLKEYYEPRRETAESA